MRSTASLLLLTFLLSGCALHVPMSQTLMFHDEGATRPAHSNGFGIGYVGTGRLTSTDFLVEEADRRFYSEEATVNFIDPANLENRSFGLYGSFYSKSGTALSATLGKAVAGIDGTFKMWKRNYLTLSGSFFGGAQAFIQHRTFNSSLLGAAVGAGYRYGHQLFDVETLLENEAPSMVPTYEVIPVHSAGGRAFVVLRPGAEAPGVLLGNLYVGYAPAFGQPIITFGVTMHST